MTWDVAVAAIAGPGLPGFHLGERFQAELRAAPEPYGTTPDQLYVAERVIWDPWESHWIWAPALARDGYGKAYRNGKDRMAHRAAYEAFRGSIPDGMTLDHLCERRSCVNPWHTEPVTNRENIRRGRRSDTSETCGAGHPWAEFARWQTLANGNSYRKCRECHRLRDRDLFRGAPLTVPKRVADTHCSSGHELDEANAYLNPDDGVIRCRTCQRGNESRSKSARRLEELTYRAALLDRLAVTEGSPRVA